MNPLLIAMLAGGGLNLLGNQSKKKETAEARKFEKAKALTQWILGGQGGQYIGNAPSDLMAAGQGALLGGTFAQGLSKAGLFGGDNNTYNGQPFQDIGPEGPVAQTAASTALTEGASEVPAQTPWYQLQSGPVDADPRAYRLREGNIQHGDRFMQPSMNNATRQLMQSQAATEISNNPWSLMV